MPAIRRLASEAFVTSGSYSGDGCLRIYVHVLHMCIYIICIDIYMYM